MSWGRRFSEVSGQNTVEGNKYGSQPKQELSLHLVQVWGVCRHSETEENCQIGHKYGGGLVDVTLVVLMNRPTLLGDFPWCTSTNSALFPLHVHVTFLYFSFAAFLVWYYGACCSLYPVLSTPGRSRQMATFPESGSDGDLFLLKVFFFSVQSVGFLSQATLVFF